MAIPAPTRQRGGNPVPRVALAVVVHLGSRGSAPIDEVRGCFSDLKSRHMNQSILPFVSSEFYAWTNPGIFQPRGVQITPPVPSPPSPLNAHPKTSGTQGTPNLYSRYRRPQLPVGPLIRSHVTYSRRRWTICMCRVSSRLLRLIQWQVERVL